MKGVAVFMYKEETLRYAIGKGRKIHQANRNMCRHVQRINIVENPWELIEQGYTFCQNCCRSEYEKECSIKKEAYLKSLGFKSEEQFYETVYGDDQTVGEVLEIKETGYQDEDLYMAYNSSNYLQGTAFLLKIQNKYAVFENYGGCDYILDMDLSDIPVFDSYEKAKEMYDSIYYNTPLEKQIEELKSKLPEYEAGIYVDVKYNYCTLKYNDFLLIDKLHDFNADMVKKEIQRFENLYNRLSKKNITIDSVYKKREFSGNQRYYIMEIYDENSDDDSNNTYTEHIPSTYQHICNRKVLDFFEKEFLE